MSIMKCLLQVSILLSLVMSNHVHAVNRDQLWLPREYSRYLKSLNDAAEKSEQTDRCLRVVAGRLSQEQSSRDHPIFVVTCRDIDRKTFAYFVDGLSLDILNDPSVGSEQSAQEQIVNESIKLKWESCSNQLQQRTQGLQGVVWLGPDMPEPEIIDETSIVFTKDFDALSSAGKPLNYTSRCHFDDDKKKLEIDLRRPAQPNETESG